MSLWTKLMDRLRPDEPLPVPSLPAEAIKEVFEAWPDRSRAIKSARRAGFKIGRSWPNPVDLETLGKCAYIAAAAAIPTREALEQTLETEFDSFLRALFAEHRRKAKTPWGGTPEFVFELVLIWSVIDRLSIRRLRRAGWDRAMAALVIAAADAAQLGRRSAHPVADVGQGPA